MRKTFLAIMLTLFCIEMAQGQLTPDQKRSLRDSGVMLMEIEELEKMERYDEQIDFARMDLESIRQIVDRNRAIRQEETARTIRESFEEGQQLAQRIVDDRKKFFWLMVIIPVVGIGGAIIVRRLLIRRSLTG